MMSFGGNNRAQVFFKQHGWSDGGKIEAKYTSRAAELYRQLLSKEVAKSTTEDNSLGSPRSPLSSESANADDGFPDAKVLNTPKEQSVDLPEKGEKPISPKAPSYSMKKALVTKKVGSKTGRLGVKKLTTKTSGNLYDQKPEDPAPSVNSSANSTTSTVSSFPSRFEYGENITSSDNGTGGRQERHDTFPHLNLPVSSMNMEWMPLLGRRKHPVIPKCRLRKHARLGRSSLTQSLFHPLSFFGDQSNTSDAESQISLQKFSGSVAISSADLFGRGANESRLDLTASELLSRISFQASQDMTALKNIAGETGKKLTSLASNFLTDVQDRIL